MPETIYLVPDPAGDIVSSVGLARQIPAARNGKRYHAGSIKEREAERVGVLIEYTPAEADLRDAEETAATEAQPAELVAAASVEIDRLAEATRLLFITAGAGQALIYEAKRSEAARWQGEVAAGDTPDPAGYPLIAGRASRLGIDGQDVADEWTARTAAWMALAAAIENVREDGKERVALEGLGADFAARLDAIVATSRAGFDAIVEAAAQ